MGSGGRWQNITWPYVFNFRGRVTATDENGSPRLYICAVAVVVHLRVCRGCVSMPSPWLYVCALAVIVHLRGRRGCTSASPSWSCICAVVVVYICASAMIVYLRVRCDRA